MKRELAQAKIDLQSTMEERDSAKYGFLWEINIYAFTFLKAVAAFWVLKLRNSWAHFFTKIIANNWVSEEYDFGNRL